MKRWFRELWAEARARSAGRRAMGNDKSTFHSARGTMGALGMNRSNAWDYLENDNGAYLRSMEKEAMIPPSLFVSERDRTRFGEPMPLVERCIEDHGNPEALEVSQWDMASLKDAPDLVVPPAATPAAESAEPTEGRSPDLHG